jgi:protein SCO1/2
MKKSSVISAILKLKLLVSFSILILACAAFGQKVEHYNSPLYSPRNYDPAQSEPNGLPKVLQEVGITQQLGSELPLDAEFKDENGNPVRLGEYFGKGKPVILALVYYECPMLCNQVLNGLTGSLKGISFDAGKEFDVVAISFDARENDKPGLARNKKEGYLARYERPGSENGWHFLTGSQSSIDAVTKAVGFGYVYDEKTNQFAHASAVMMTTPDGKMSRYYYGIDYEPRQLKFGIMDSAQSKVGNPVEQLLLYCYHYDPSNGKYGLSVLRVIRIAGIATILGMIGMMLILWRKNKKRDLS